MRNRKSPLAPAILGAVDGGAHGSSDLLDHPESASAHRPAISLLRRNSRGAESFSALVMTIEPEVSERKEQKRLERVRRKGEHRRACPGLRSGGTGRSRWRNRSGPPNARLRKKHFPKPGDRKRKRPARRRASFVIRDRPERPAGFRVSRSDRAPTARRVG